MAVRQASRTAILDFGPSAKARRKPCHETGTGARCFSDLPFGQRTSYYVPFVRRVGPPRPFPSVKVFVSIVTFWRPLQPFLSRSSIRSCRGCCSTSSTVYICLATNVSNNVRNISRGPSRDHPPSRRATAKIAFTISWRNCTASIGIRIGPGRAC
jgi:hypothetical protein